MYNTQDTVKEYILMVGIAIMVSLTLVVFYHFFFSLQYDLTEGLSFIPTGIAKSILPFSKIALLISLSVAILLFSKGIDPHQSSNQKKMCLAGLFFVGSALSMAAFLLAILIGDQALHLLVDCISVPIYILSFRGFVQYVHAIDFSFSQGATQYLKLDKEKSQKGYSLALSTKGNYLNIPNPFRGIIVLGGAGAGKTASFLNPIVSKSIAKGHSLFCYDYKFPEISELVHAEASQRGETDMLKVIDFNNVAYSLRVNPLSPKYLTSESIVMELAETLAKNLIPLREQGNFWFNSFIAYLTAVILFLRNSYPQYCTLPHTISIMLDPRIYDVVDMLSTVPEAAEKIMAVKFAIGNRDETGKIEGGGDGQKAGILGTVATYLNRIVSKNMYYVLSAHELDLKINDAERKKYICLGNHSELQNSNKPVLALITTLMMRLNNTDALPGEKRLPLLFAVDEFPTIFIPDVEQIPATGRSRKIITFLLAQDKSQIERDYGKERCEAIIANCANVFIGNNGNAATLKLGADMLGKRAVSKRSTSSGSSMNSSMSSSNSHNVSITEREKELVASHEIGTFKAGEFVAKVVDTQQTYYKPRMAYKEYERLPLPMQFNRTDMSIDSYVELNYFNIKMQSKQLIDGYIERGFALPGASYQANVVA